MTNSKIKRTWAGSQPDNINLSNDNSFSLRECLFIERLEKKLGKSRPEVAKLMSKNLLSLLTLVPFNTERLL